MRIKYALYKSYFSKFSAHDYDGKTKTIEVDLPERKKISWPKDWRKSGNSIFTPGGTIINFWNSGIAENFYINLFVTKYCQYSRTINPAIDARQQVIDTVKEFESK